MEILFFAKAEHQPITTLLAHWLRAEYPQSQIHLREMSLTSGDSGDFVFIVEPGTGEGIALLKQLRQSHLDFARHPVLLLSPLPLKYLEQTYPPLFLKGTAYLALPVELSAIGQMIEMLGVLARETYTLYDHHAAQEAELAMDQRVAMHDVQTASDLMAGFESFLRQLQQEAPGDENPIIPILVREFLHRQAKDQQYRREIAAKVRRYIRHRQFREAVREMPSLVERILAVPQRQSLFCQTLESFLSQLPTETSAPTWAKAINDRLGELVLKPPAPLPQTIEQCRRLLRRLRLLALSPDVVRRLEFIGRTEKPIEILLIDDKPERKRLLIETVFHEADEIHHLQLTQGKFHLTERNSYYEGLAELFRKYQQDREEPYDFILLDFFLTEVKELTATDFLRDLIMLKDRLKIYSTEYIFLVSSYKESIVEEISAGELDNYFSFFEVHSGENPEQADRFLARLSSFIEAKFDSDERRNLHKVLSIKDRIDDRYFHHPRCKVYRPEHPLSCHQCLEHFNSLSLEFMQAYRSLEESAAAVGKAPIFNEELERVVQAMVTTGPQSLREYLEKIVERIYMITRSYIWYPESDWPIIAHEIDYIQSFWEKAGIAHPFSCPFLAQELRRRSELY